MSCRFTFFMLLRSAPAWLRLSREDRQRFQATHIAPVLARYPAVTVRFYDAEAFSGRCTDIGVFETTDLQAYTFLIDGLRDTAFFSEPYFEVVDVIPAVEDGYAAYDRVHGVSAA